MENGFWEDRWQAGRTGFHRSDVHPTLIEFHNAMPTGPVFVPLAGKTVDMHWLASQGHAVIGVELVDLAVRAFFDEQALAYDVETAGPLQRYTARDKNITVYQGNVFDLTVEHLATVRWVHDRAALVALPENLRTRYGAHLTGVLPVQAELLITTFEYDQALMAGPPFSVPRAEVEKVYPSFTFEHLRSRNLGALARIEGDGIQEHVYRGRRAE